jgi:hypothetical protein
MQWHLALGRFPLKVFVAEGHTLTRYWGLLKLFVVSYHFFNSIYCLFTEAFIKFFVLKL